MKKLICCEICGERIDKSDVDKTYIRVHQKWFMNATSEDEMVREKGKTIYVCDDCKWSFWRKMRELKEEQSRKMTLEITGKIV